MSDTKSGDDKTLSVTPKKTLTLKRHGAEQGIVRQNMPHGRSKPVVVETKKRKFSIPGERHEPASAQMPASAPAPAPVATRLQQAAPVNTSPVVSKTSRRQPERSGMVLNELSRGEMEARRRALEGSVAREQEERIRAVEDMRRRAEDDEYRRKEREESVRRQVEEEARLKKEAESHRRAEAEARRRAPSAVQASAVDEEDEVRPRSRHGGAGNAGRHADGRAGVSAAMHVRRIATPEVSRPAKTKGEGGDRRRGKLTLNSALSSEDGDARARSLAAMRRRQEKFKRAIHNEPREKVVREVIIPEIITIQELAQRMSERAVDVIKFFMKQGQMMKSSDVIDADTAELVAGEFGHTVRRVAESDIEDGLFDIADRIEDLVSRPPAVTIMGHVDHGKTSLLDAIRNTNVVSGEAGSITQHIGAYQVEKDGQKVTFIDTPGHAAFTAMRARGAQATDIAILVVAADAAVMPQTIESISHAKAASVPIIVAINKMDKPSADANKVRTDLLRHEVCVESMGGETLDVEVSAKTGKGLDNLLESILLQAEVLDLKSNPNRTAEGVVIEAKLDKSRGPIATLLIQTGTLVTGDILVAGSQWGRVRALIDDHGAYVKEAPPSMPVEILGLQGMPQAGDRFAVVNNEARAREITEYRQRIARDKAVAKHVTQRGSLEQMMSQLQSSSFKEFPLIIKGDMQGLVEAIVIALNNIGTDEVRVSIVHAGAGAITESDVTLAETSGAAIIGFNVRANGQARHAAEQAGVEIRYYNIIYSLIADIKDMMSGLLSPERRETFIGNAEILEVFHITKVGKVAGCCVTEGKVERGSGVRLIRDNVAIYEGTLKTLKRFKDEVSEVQVGQECGIVFQHYEDIRQGDIIECFHVEMVIRKL